MQPYPYGSGGRSLVMMMMYPPWIEITGGHSHTWVAPTAMIMECATGLAGVVVNPATQIWSVGGQHYPHTYLLPSIATATSSWLISSL